MAFTYDRDLVNLDELSRLTINENNVLNSHLLTPNDILNNCFISSNLSKNNIYHSCSDEYQSDDDLPNNEELENDDDLYINNSDSDISDDESISSNDSWENVANKRMREIIRKEDIIVQKDQKATRLIGIIREKNTEIESLKKKTLEQQRMIWKLHKQLRDSGNTSKIF